MIIQDGSDESNCEYGCSGDQFMCSSGIIRRWPFYGFCLDAVEQCNGIEECEDGSDESDCAHAHMCRDGEWKCADARHGDPCILAQHKCDGHRDCADGSDESDVTCEGFKCLADTEQCRNGTLRPEEGEVARGYCYPHSSRYPQILRRLISGCTCTCRFT